MNFAGGGHQVKLNISIDGSEGHSTVRKDPAGIVTVTTCSSAQAASYKGQCAPPSYTDCSDCQSGSKEFAW
jgi:hypothetical protein